MISFDNLITYHGTSESVADDLVVGNVQISRGGGELGKGFYLGTQLHVAKAWAKQMHNSQAVVEFCTFEERFFEFDIRVLDYEQAHTARDEIRAKQATRTFTFGNDVVWSPIVVGPEIYCDQQKWESQHGEGCLNSAFVMRRKR